MKAIHTKIAGCYRIQVETFPDARGYFTNAVDVGKVRSLDPSFSVARVNRSLTHPQGAIRGLHFQRPPEDEGKLVQCLQGAIFDVCVDIRPESPTYLQWIGTELSAQNQELMLVPKGCAHGFQTLRDDCVIEYLTTGRYSPAHEGGLRWDDPGLGIAWPLPCALTSERDAAWPLLGKDSRVNEGVLGSQRDAGD
jgi:dTDP-4-dehydrorhamnose 3,5-epimerase